MKRLLNSRALGAALDCLLLAMGLLGTVSAFLTRFNYPNLALTITVTALLGAFFAVLSLALAPKRRFTVLAIIGGAWLLAALILLPQLRDGPSVFLGYLLPDLSRVVAYDFGEIATPTTAQNMECTLWFLFLMVPYAAALSTAVVARKSGFLSLLLTAPVFAVTWILGGLPDATFLTGLVFTFWVAVMLRGRVVRGQKTAEAALSLLCLGVSGALMATLLTWFPKADYTPSTAAYAVRDDIVGVATDLRDFGLFGNWPGVTGGAPLTGSDGSVNLNAMGSIRFAERDILRVHSEMPQSLYLRAYAASEYTGTSWEQADEDRFAALGLGIDPLFYLAGNGVFQRTDADEVTIEVLRGSPEFLFSPYLLGGGNPAGAAGDAMIPSDGRQSYAFDTYAANYAGRPVIAGDGGFSEYTDSTYVWFNSPVYEFEGYDLTYTVSPWGPMFWQMEDIPEGVVERLYTQVYLDDSIPDTLEAFYPDSRRDAEYMRYIVEEYTKLPDGLRDTLLAWRERYHMQSVDVYLQPWDQFRDTNVEDTPFWNWVYVASRVARHIQSSATYSTTPGAQPRNHDFVEYFLLESQKGYCVHFASATALMLRALGIPARYVEGYVVGERAFGSDGWATIPSKSAHAWAEIWVPDLGWIPVESTPGGSAVEQSVISVPATSAPIPNVNREQVREDVEDRARPDRGNSAPTEEDTPEEEPPDEAGPGIGVGSLPAGKTVDPKLVRMVMNISLAALGCAGLAALPYLCRTLLRRRREHKFSSDDTNRAALEIYTYLDKMARYGFLPSKEAASIAAKARFSPHSISNDELAALHVEMERTRRLLAVCFGPFRRLLMWLYII